MINWLDILIAAPIAVLVVFGLWKASAALTRRGIVVRPVDMMDASMTRIEKRFAPKARPEQQTPETRD